MVRHGILFIVVGPSGAGKDTLIDGAREMLAGNPRFVFAKRTITRPVDAGGEAHESLSEEGFAAREQSGDFLVTWQAHGLFYGLPASLQDVLAEGRHVIANGSRHALADLAGKARRLVVLHVTTPTGILAERLAARGRESAVQIALRLQRAASPIGEGFEIIEIANDSSLEEGIQRFVETLEGRSRALFVQSLPIESGRGHVAYLPADSPVGAENYAGPGRVEIAASGRTIRAEVHILDAGAFLATGDIGLSKAAFHELSAPEGAEATITRTPPQRSRDALRKKVHGGELSESQYETVLHDIVSSHYTESEVAAFLVAATRGLSDDEVVALARVRTHFVPKIDWNESIVVDKHSMGGVPGSRITLIVTPIVAAHGLAMPKTSSRAITSAAGTADAMEVLARVDLSFDEVRSVVARARGCIAWNGRMNHSPLDDVMNAITRPLGLDSNRWSVASIISKKVTAGSSHVTVDIPYGARTKLPTKTEAEDLGRLFAFAGRGVGLHIEARATDGSAPIGRGIGPALEVRDVLLVLENRPEAPADLRAKAISFASRILAWDPAIGTVENGIIHAENLLNSGKAKEAFLRIIEAQGARVPMVRPATPTRLVRAKRSGRIGGVDGWIIAGIARRAGAPSDKGAGVDILCRIGEEVMHAQPLFAIHANDVNALEAADELAKISDGILIGAPLHASGSTMDGVRA